MVGRQGHSREDPIHTQQHIPVHLALPKPQVTLQDVFTYKYPSSSSHLSFHNLSPHLYANSPLSPHQRPLGWGLYQHHAWSHRSLALADSPPLTTLERHDAHVCSDTLFSQEHTHEIRAFLEKVDNYKMVLNLVYHILYICPKPQDFNN